MANSVNPTVAHAFLMETASTAAKPAAADAYFLPWRREEKNLEHKENAFLEKEPVGRLMAKYAVPCIISLLVAALYNIVDQIFIANASYLGSYGNAANIQRDLDSCWRFPWLFSGCLVCFRITLFHECNPFRLWFKHSDLRTGLHNAQGIYYLQNLNWNLKRKKIISGHNLLISNI